MSTGENLNPVVEGNAVLEIPGNYQPIHLEDTVGTILLGVFAIISLIGWIRAEARYRTVLNNRK